MQDAQALGRDVRLLVRLTKGRRLSRLPCLASPARNSPGATEVAPRDPMLHQDADRGIPHDETRRAEPAPESLTVRPLDPRIPRIAFAQRRKRWWKTHGSSLPCFAESTVRYGRRQCVPGGVTTPPIGEFLRPHGAV